MRLLIAIAGAAILAGCGDQPEFRPLAGQGNFAMVVPPGTDPATFAQLAKAKCGRAAQCAVYAWTDAASAATGFPITDAEAASLAFSYSLNRATGFEQALWDCRRFHRPDRGECLAHD